MTEGNIRLGEVCLLTDDVPRLADFYRALLGVDGHSDDPAGSLVFLRSFPHETELKE